MSGRGREMENQPLWLLKGPSMRVGPYLAFMQVRLGSMRKLFSLKLTINEGSILDFLVI